MEQFMGKGFEKGSRVHGKGEGRALGWSQSVPGVRVAENPFEGGIPRSHKLAKLAGLFFLCYGDHFARDCEHNSHDPARRWCNWCQQPLRHPGAAGSAAAQEEDTGIGPEVRYKSPPTQKVRYPGEDPRRGRGRGPATLAGQAPGRGGGGSGLAAVPGLGA